MKREIKILIGYDGSRYCDAAIDDLRRAGLSPRAKVLVVAVGDAPTIPPLASHHVIEKAVIGERVSSIVDHANRQVSEALKHASELALSASKRLKSYFPYWQVHSEVLAGSPAEELIRKADHWKADLVVVGSQGRSAIGRLILGSVSLEVASDSSCSVRIGRQSEREAELKEPRILVGIDGPRGAERILRKILGRHWPERTELRIVGVADGDAMTTRPRFSGIGVSEATNKIVELVATRGLIVSAGVLEGDPKKALLEEAREWEADCIVVGSSESRKTQGLFERNVPIGLAADAECSVEIVR